MRSPLTRALVLFSRAEVARGLRKQSIVATTNASKPTPKPRNNSTSGQFSVISLKDECGITCAQALLAFSGARFLRLILPSTGGHSGLAKIRALDSHMPTARRTAAATTRRELKGGIAIPTGPSPAPCARFGYRESPRRGITSHTANSPRPAEPFGRTDRCCLMRHVGFGATCIYPAPIKQLLRMTGG